jgi:hypothetical protein
MSLIKIYRVACEGRPLAARLGTPTAGLAKGHEPFSPTVEPSAAKARRSAIKAGWTRIHREMPIGRDANGPTSVIAYDLCPSCSKLVG